jgi:hypothetical protein
MLVIFHSRFTLAVSVLWLLCAILEFAGALKTSRFFTMWILLCVVVVVVLSVMLLVVFSRADGDFSLMMKGRTPQSVIEDKVVWITGASQGLGKQCSAHILLGVLLLLHK